MHIWQKQLADGIKSTTELLDYVHLSIDNLPYKVFNNEFITKIPKNFADKIVKYNPYDPILLQVLTRQAEILQDINYNKDPVNEYSKIISSGLIHKYYGRVLLIVTGACGIHCRYCFRRHFPYNNNIINPAELKKIISYIEQDSTINEVILSGGDPFSLADNKISTILNQINNIKHVTTIRIHTRMPVILPSRITDSLLSILKNSDKHIVIVLHINHANEIDENLAEAVLLLKKSNVILLNQSVLLRDINDNVNILADLSKKLFEIGVMPYYLHLLDKVIGTSHFETSENKAKLIFNNLLQILPGYLVPRLVYDDGKNLHKSLLGYG